MAVRAERVAVCLQAQHRDAVGEASASVHEVSKGSSILGGDPGFVRARRNGKMNRMVYTVIHREFWKWTVNVGQHKERDCRAGKARVRGASRG